MGKKYLLTHAFQMILLPKILAQIRQANRVTGALTWLTNLEICILISFRKVSND